MFNLFDDEGIVNFHGNRLRNVKKVNKTKFSNHRWLRKFRRRVTKIISEMSSEDGEFSDLEKYAVQIKLLIFQNN